jgi:transcription initiation factor IIE alpha subunit
MNELDSAPLEFDCPKCGKHLKKTFRWAKGPNPTCPHCGLKFEASQFRGEIRKAEQAIADLKRTLGNFKLG